MGRWRVCHGSPQLPAWLLPWPGCGSEALPRSQSLVRVIAIWAAVKSLVPPPAVGERLEGHRLGPSQASILARGGASGEEEGPWGKGWGWGGASGAGPHGYNNHHFWESSAAICTSCKHENRSKQSTETISGMYSTDPLTVLKAAQSVKRKKTVGGSTQVYKIDPYKGLINSSKLKGNKKT